ncbi:MAG: hypothetical protein ACTHLW_01530 [Verrucomicrobiota bacterium]
MSELSFRHDHRVAYAECTVGNHIYYGRYLDVLESARGEFSGIWARPFFSFSSRTRFFL